MAEEPDREYVPHEKHKWPKGNGSHCPHGLKTPDAQALLERAVQLADLSTSSKKALWVVDGLWCFKAYQTYPNGPSPHIWHGFPVAGAKAGEQVLYALHESGHITRDQLRDLRRQKTLPDEWPS